MKRSESSGLVASIDSTASGAHFIAMLQRLALLALIAALLVSLAGQGVARAGVPSSPSEASASVKNSVECMEKMAQSPMDEEKGGCSLADCIAAVMASCSAVVLMPQPMTAAPVPHASALISVAPVRVLFGRSMPPDLRPPSSLI
jgi:hypothetical protein